MKRITVKFSFPARDALAARGIANDRICGCMEGVGYEELTYDFEATPLKSTADGQVVLWQFEVEAVLST